MQDLVDLATAKQHLGVTDDRDNAHVREKLLEATERVWQYLDTPNDPAWQAVMASWNVATGSPPTTTPTPAVVRAAILRVLADLWRNRGEDPVQVPEPVSGELAPGVKMLLGALRRLVVA